jgi:hypothetical protein
MELLVVSRIEPAVAEPYARVREGQEERLLRVHFAEENERIGLAPERVGGRLEADIRPIRKRPIRRFDVILGLDADRADWS